MLAIRMQRTGRKGHAMFRIVVQESRLTPTSGKVVANLGSYDPHGKVAILDKEKAAFYLEHGARPSDRAARLLQGEGVKLPKWVSLSESKEGKLRNPEKLRKNQPKEANPEQPDVEREAPASAEEAQGPEAAAEADTETKEEA